MSDRSDISREGTGATRCRRALHALRACHAALMRSADERSLLSGVCDALHRQGGYDGACTAPLGERHGELEATACAGTASPRLRVDATEMTGLRAGNPVTQNLTEATRLLLPLRSGDATIAVLAIWVEAGEGFDEDDRELLAAAADDIAFGIVAMRTRRDRDRLLAALETSPDFIGILTLDGRVSYCNGTGLRALGMSPEHMKAGHPIETCHPDWAARLLREEGIPSALRSGVWQGETALRSGNGEEIPVSQVVVSHHEDGEARYLSTILRDLRPHRRYESRLKANEHLYRRIIHTAREGFRLINDHLTPPENPGIWYRLPVYKGNATLIFDLSEVRYLQADGHYTRVFTLDGDHLSTQSLSQVERQLDPARFLRTHRSYIVNVDRIMSIERNERQLQLVIEGPRRDVVPVSRRNADSVRQALGVLM